MEETAGPPGILHTPGTPLNIPGIPVSGPARPQPCQGSGDFAPGSAEHPGMPARQPISAIPAEPPPPVTGEDTPRPPDQPSAGGDLLEALRPVIEPIIDQFLYTPGQNIHSYLEPMLRSTVRRAIAEQMEHASPFRQPSGWDKFAWKIKALLGSQTYSDIIFHRTRRYQVEEVYLLRPQTRSLISYASNNPARHAKPAKVQDTVKKIAAKTAGKNHTGTLTPDWEDGRHLVIRRGKHSLLAAIVRGTPNTVLSSDLDYTHRQAEHRFGSTLEDGSDIHLQILQPLLENCLLIQSPAIPNCE